MIRKQVENYVNCYADKITDMEKLPKSLVLLAEIIQL